MRLAYVDPPYYGLAAKFYGDVHPEAAVYDTLDAHAELIERVADEYDAFTFSMTSGNLLDLLPLFPKGVRIAAWVKPFASYNKGVSPAYTWEPVVFRPAPRPHDLTTRTVRDSASIPIAMKRGLRGAKPEAFCRWVMDLMGWQPGDTVDDVFPGTGVFCRVTETASQEIDYTQEALA